MSDATTVPIGFLNRRIAIETPAVVADGSTTWIALATVWAGFAQTAATERDDDGRYVGVVRWRFTIRWRGDVTSAARIRFGTRVFRILAVADPTGNSRYLAIEAEEET